MDDTEFQRRLNRLVMQMQWEEHERTWRDREVTREDARRAMDILRSHEGPRDPFFLESLLSRSIGRVCRRLEALETEIVEVHREKAELAARVDGAVARADLLRDVARHEREVYAYDIARIRDALRLEASASISDVVKRAEELAARGER